MSDPKRLLDELERLEPEARKALEAARDIEPDELAHGAVWGALVGRLPPGSGPGGAAGDGGAATAAAAAGSSAAGTGSAGAGAAASSAVEAGATAGAVQTGSTVAGGVAAGPGVLLKLLALGASAGFVIVAAGHAVLTNGSPPVVEPAPPAPVLEPAPSTLLSARPRQLTTAEPDEAPRGVPAAISKPPRELASARTARAGAVRDEARLVASARQRLLHDDAAGALRLLEQARHRYPRGVLVQEREALAVEALAKSGHNEAAAQRAQEFQLAHPESPLKGRVQDAAR